MNPIVVGGSMVGIAAILVAGAFGVPEWLWRARKGAHHRGGMYGDRWGR